MNLNWQKVEDVSQELIEFNFYQKPEVYKVVIDNLVYKIFNLDDSKVFMIYPNDNDNKKLVINKFNDNWLLILAEKKDDFDYYLLKDNIRLYAKLQDLNVRLNYEAWDDFLNFKGDF